jgi:uncharacterized protein YbaR (Trm112 family)
MEETNEKETHEQQMICQNCGHLVELDFDPKGRRVEKRGKNYIRVNDGYNTLLEMDCPNCNKKLVKVNTENQEMAIFYAYANLAAMVIVKTTKRANDKIKRARRCEFARTSPLIHFVAEAFCIGEHLLRGKIIQNNRDY